MYDLDSVDISLSHENNAILYKRLNQNMLNMEKIIVSHSIVYVISGCVEIQTYDYEKFTARENEMLFIPKDSYLISDYVKNNNDMEVYLFFFDHNMTSEFLKTMTRVKTYKKKFMLPLNLSHNVLNYIQALQKANYPDIKNVNLLKTKIFELLYLLCDVNKDFINVLYADDTVQTDIQSYMIEHYDKNLKVSDWASLSGYSLSTFNRKFKKHYELSPKQWILKHNMELAKDALQNGQNVSECASEFGYQNTSNFIKSYKKIYQVTPKQHLMTLNHSF